MVSRRAKAPDGSGAASLSTTAARGCSAGAAGAGRSAVRRRHRGRRRLETLRPGRPRIRLSLARGSAGNGRPARGIEAPDKLRDLDGRLPRGRFHEGGLEQVARLARGLELAIDPRGGAEQVEQILRPERLSKPRKFGDLSLREVQEIRGLASLDAQNEEISKPLDVCEEELLEIEPRVDRAIDDRERALPVALADSLEEIDDELRIDETEHAAHESEIDRALARGEALIEQALPVAHAPLGAPGYQRERLPLERDLLEGADLLELRGDLLQLEPLEIESLAAREDRRGNLVRLGGREDEVHVDRRLLERLEERVERLRRQHVHFVDDVYLGAPLRRRVADLLAQVADLVDAAVGGAVDLDDVEVAPRGDGRRTRSTRCTARRRSGFSQLMILARRRAVVVLPHPRGPAKRYAWATLSFSTAFLSVSVMCSWPTTSEKVCGLHFRARTR